jgi:hypothetical protein
LCRSLLISLSLSLSSNLFLVCLPFFVFHPSSPITLLSSFFVMFLFTSSILPLCHPLLHIPIPSFSPSLIIIIRRQQGASQLQTASANLSTISVNIPSPLRKHFPLLLSYVTSVLPVLFYYLVLIFSFVLVLILVLVLV